MKKLFILILISCVSGVYAQDVIVKKDGSTILSKVLEVNVSDIKFKKYSNMEGPTYTIPIKDILSINYSNGDKDTFGNMLIQSNDKPNTTENSLSSYVNDGLISNNNDRDVSCNLEKSNKNAKWIYRLLRIHNLSYIGNEDVKMEASIFQTKDLASTEASIRVSIENTSDQIIYLDLANSSCRIGKSASSYYINSSTTNSSGGEVVGSINLGSIASVLGISGAAGAIAAGSTVGGNKSHGTSTTIYAERIVRIPPHTVYKLAPKIMYISVLEEPYKKDFKYGDRFKYKQPDNFRDSPWEVILSYAKEEDLDKMIKLDMGLFISEEISVKASWDKCIKNESAFPPIHYYYRVD